MRERKVIQVMIAKNVRINLMRKIRKKKMKQLVWQETNNGSRVIKIALKMFVPN
jgi:hypothetical protein